MQPDLYARWRALARTPALRDAGGAAAPPERLLQAVWLHQRLRREELRATDGRLVRVLHPGFWNRAAGPTCVSDPRCQNAEVTSWHCRQPGSKCRMTLRQSRCESRPSMNSSSSRFEGWERSDMTALYLKETIAPPPGPVYTCSCAW